MGGLIGVMVSVWDTLVVLVIPAYIQNALVENHLEALGWSEFESGASIFLKPLQHPNSLINSMLVTVRNSVQARVQRKSLMKNLLYIVSLDHIFIVECRTHYTLHWFSMRDPCVELMSSFMI